MKKIRKALKIINAEFIPAKIRYVKNHISMSKTLCPFIEIHGFLAQAEAEKLYTAASSIKTKKPCLVEIGSHQGKSSFVLGKTLQERGGGKLYCIDPFDGSGDLSAADHYTQGAGMGSGVLFKKFMENMKRNKLESFVVPLQGLSHQVLPLFPEKEIDFLFIDGNHDWESVRQDFLDWSPKLRPGGVLALHDVFATPFDNHYDGPWRVVKEFVIDNPKWIWFELVGSLAIAVKKPC